MPTRQLSLVLLTLGLIAARTASGGDTVRVEPESVPVALHRLGASPSDPIQIDGKVEASAVEPIGDGRFVLVAHDKAAEMYVVEAQTGRIVGPAVTSAALPATTEAGPKWEAMARDSKGRYYAMGSHSGKTAEEKAQRAHLVRFRFKEGGQAGEVPAVDPASVRHFVAAGPLASALGKESKDVGKLKVEGLAVREVPASAGQPARTEVVVGLREPIDMVRAFAATVAEDQAEGSSLDFRALFRFDAGLREGVPATLTSLLYLPAWKGFFVLTASEDKDNAFHGNTLWFLRDDAIAADGTARPERAWDFEVAMKAEGLADLPQAGGDPDSSARLVVAYDNDAKSTHIPSRIQVVRVSRRLDRRD